MSRSMGGMLCRGGALDRSRSFHRPAAGKVLFTAEKYPKRLAPDRTSASPPSSLRILLHDFGTRCPSLGTGSAGRGSASPDPLRPCASCRMRAGTNSGIHALKQWCLVPAFGYDARRALRIVVRSEEHTFELQPLIRK